MDDDESLYNTLIIALSIGIFVVIVTLLLTKPAPESFTELYFNNHQELPEYAQDTYYSFTINNLENQNKTYNYTISKELYTLNYLCENPELWINDYSKDPALYLRDNYTISFSYEIKSGKEFDLVITDTNDNKKILNFDGSKLYLDEEELLTFQELEINKVIISNNYIQINNDSINYSLGKGYLSLHSTSYIEFSNFQIQKSIAYPVSIRYPDSKYSEEKLENLTNISLQNYDLTIRFNGLMRLSQGAEISYNTSLIVNDIEFKPNRTNANYLTLKVQDSIARVYYNNEYLATVVVNNTPKINYSETAVSDVYIKSRDGPETIKYTLPKYKEITTSIVTPELFEKEDQTIDIKNITQNFTEEDSSTFNSFYEREKISYNAYRITTIYEDITKNNTMNIGLTASDKIIYLVSANTDTNKLNVSYLTNGTLVSGEYNITAAVYNRIIVDVNNNTIAVIFNGRTVFRKVVDTATGGLIVYDYEDIIITSAYVEDRATGFRKIFKRQRNYKCEPILLDKFTYIDNTDIADGESKTIYSNATFNEDFEIAKVQVTLDNDQEIHYWVKKE